MAFTVQELSDLARLLVEHPEWRSELRRLLLSEELLSLPELMRQLAEKVDALAEAQRRSEARLTRLEEAVAALAEAQRRSEARLTRLEEAVAALAEAQRRSEARLTRLEEAVAALAEAQRRSEEHLGRLEEALSALAEAQRDMIERLKRIDIKLAKAEGRSLELEYREKAHAYFGVWLRKTRLADRNALADTLEAQLSRGEFRDALLIDLVVRGQPWQRPEVGEMWLAVEVSVVVDEGDVTRAARRAELLRRAGYRAIPVVAGEEITSEAQLEVQRQSVAVLQDGHESLWDEALAKALK